MSNSAAAPCGTSTQMFLTFPDRFLYNTISTISYFRVNVIIDQILTLRPLFGPQGPLGSRLAPPLGHLLAQVSRRCTTPNTAVVSRTVFGEVFDRGFIVRGVLCKCSTWPESPTNTEKSLLADDCLSQCFLTNLRDW